METFLSHPVALITISLFLEDGIMRKCQKYNIVKWFEEHVKAVEDIDTCQRGSKEMQMMQGNNLYRTFAELGQAYLDKLTRGVQITYTVIGVFDRYNCESVK